MDVDGGVGVRVVGVDGVWNGEKEEEYPSARDAARVLVRSLSGGSIRAAAVTQAQ
eukprot:gene50368-41263_t